MANLYVEETPTVEIYAAEALTTAEHRQLDDWLDEVFSQEDDGQRYEWASNDWRLLLKVGGQAVSHVGIVERTVTVAGQPVKVGGIGAVATRPSWQRRGLAGQLMERAAAFMRADLRLEFGLLVCGDKMVPYYRRLGWQVAAVPLLVDQSQGKIAFPATAMALALTAKPWPEGLIDFCGRPW